MLVIWRINLLFLWLSYLQTRNAKQIQLKAALTDPSNFLKDVLSTRRCQRGRQSGAWRFPCARTAIFWSSGPETTRPRAQADTGAEVNHAQEAGTGGLTPSPSGHFPGYSVTMSRASLPSWWIAVRNCLEDRFTVALLTPLCFYHQKAFFL